MITLISWLNVCCNTCSVYSQRRAGRCMCRRNLGMLECIIHKVRTIFGSIHLFFLVPRYDCSNNFSPEDVTAWTRSSFSLFSCPTPPQDKMWMISPENPSSCALISRTVTLYWWKGMETSLNSEVGNTKEAATHVVGWEVQSFKTILNLIWKSRAPNNKVPIA